MTPDRLNQIRKLNDEGVVLADDHSLRQYTDAMRDLLSDYEIAIVERQAFCRHSMFWRDYATKADVILRQAAAFLKANETVPTQPHAEGEGSDLMSLDASRKPKPDPFMAEIQELRLANAGTAELLQAFSTPLSDDYVRAHTQMPRTLEDFEEYVREQQRGDVLEVIQNYLSWPAPPKPQEMPLTEVKARAVVRAWERYGQCLSEFGGESAHLCDEWDDALDDAIIELRRHLNAEAT